jgi:transcriptional regulator GlxA family with amidase domain
VAVETLFRNITRLARSRPDRCSERLSEAAYALLLRLGQEAGPRFPEPVTRALRFLETRLTSRIGSREIARAAGLSVTHLNRLFRHYLGVPPVRYLLDERMRLAETLLRQSHLSIQSVSEQVGFPDALYFSAQFKKKHGVSPKGYREKPLLRKGA